MCCETCPFYFWIFFFKCISLGLKIGSMEFKCGEFHVFSWEDFKVTVFFTDSNGTPVDITKMRFRFIYSDTSGKSVVASYDGKTRVNNVVHDNTLTIIFNAGSFSNGRISVTRKYFIDDPDFQDGVQTYGVKGLTNIVIVP